jgi:hypothetical protein
VRNVGLTRRSTASVLAMANQDALRAYHAPS